MHPKEGGGAELKGSGEAGGWGGGQGHRFCSWGAKMKQFDHKISKYTRCRHTFLKPPP